MKKVLSICLIICAILATGCKNKDITTIYSIGCIDYNVSSQTDVEGFQTYMESVAEYNITLQFTSPTLEENDAKAKKHYNEQLAKIDAETACSYIHGNEFIIYGLDRLSDDGTVKLLEKTTYTGNGVIE